MQNLKRKAIVGVSVAVGLYLGVDALTIETILNGHEATGIDRAALIAVAAFLVSCIGIGAAAWLMVPVLLGSHILGKIRQKTNS